MDIYNFSSPDMYSQEEKNYYPLFSVEKNQEKKKQTKQQITLDFSCSKSTKIERPKNVTFHLSI